MAKQKIQFDTVSYGNLHDGSARGMSDSYAFSQRVSKWNRRAASNSMRSTKAWAERLSKAQLSAGLVTFEEVASEKFEGLVKRVYTHNAQQPSVAVVEAETVATVVATVKQKAAPKQRRQRKRQDTVADKWKRLSIMRTEMDRLYAERV